MSNGASWRFVNDQRTTGVGEAPSTSSPLPHRKRNSTSCAPSATSSRTCCSARAPSSRTTAAATRRNAASWPNTPTRICSSDILPLLDNLERALGSASETQNAGDPAAALDAYRAGVELIRRQLLELLRKKGVTPIEALGTDFDPHLHQAVTREPSDAHREGEVMEELQRGYKLGERLLRPAMVKVATRE